MMGDNDAVTEFGIQKDTLLSVFNLVSLSEETIKECMSILDSVFESSSLRGVSTMVKAWSKAVRVILADEDYTRVSVSTSTGFSRSSRNLQNRLRRSGFLSVVEFNQLLCHQGNRPIPPFLLDPSLVRGLLPNPSFVDLRRLVILSNISRTASPPEFEDLVDSLETFSQNVENSHDFGFDFSRSVRSVCHRLKYSGLSRRSSWNLSNHSSLEFSRAAGGKTENIRARIIDDFSLSPVQNIICKRPERDLKDIFGNLVCTPEIWDLDLRVCDSFYLDRMGGDRVDDLPDNRLGEIGLLWAIREIIANGATSDSEFGFVGYDPFEIHIPENVSFKCRVTVQPEEGWKSRVLTIADLSLSIVGQIFRSMVDPIMWSERTNEIGLLEKVKLYTFMRQLVGNPRTLADLNSDIFLPEYAESVDLTTATDTPPRRVVRQFLDAFVSRIDSQFVKFAVELGCSKREFIIPPQFMGYRIPTVHNSAIFMGEGCSGTFLNTMSMWVRSVASEFSQVFGPFPENWDDSDCIQFIEENHQRIQEFLDHVNVSVNGTSTQSGDDVIILNPVRQKTVLRILYLMVGMKPSGSTWYSSSQYGTFTEETIIKTHDSRGWRFVDVIKPRLFNTNQSIAREDPILSRIRQIKDTTFYVRDDRVLLDRIIESVDRMISDVPTLKRALDKSQVSRIFPGQLGGISHPAVFGMEPSSLSLEEKRVLQYLSSLNIWDRVERSYTEPESPDGLQAVLNNFIAEIKRFEVVDINAITLPDQQLIDITTIPVESNLGYGAIVRRQNDALSRLGFQRLGDALSRLRERLEFTTLLREETQVSADRTLIKSRNRYSQLVAESSATTVSDSDEVLWSFMNNFSFENRKLINRYAISRSTIDELSEMHHLVSCSVRSNTFV